MITYAAFGLQALAVLVQIFFLMKGSKKKEILTPVLLASSSVLLLITMIQRSIQIRFVAVTNTFESLVFFSMVLMIILVVYHFISRNKSIRWILFGGTFIALVLLALASSPIAPKAVKPPIPALQSNWLVIHVMLSFIGEAFFAVAFVASILYLASRDEEKRVQLDRLTYTSIMIGFPIFTAGALIFGAIWASYAWGRFWGWDPKEVWALITWLTYTGFLHFRLFRKKSGSVAAWLSIGGFVFTLFTFFGVNFLLSGLHSYG